MKSTFPEDTGAAEPRTSTPDHAQAPPEPTRIVRRDPYTLLAAWILEMGVSCRAAVVRTQALGMRNAEGNDMFAVMLTVLDQDEQECQVWIGEAVPAAALTLLQRGAVLPVKRMPDGDDRDVAIDWEAAIASKRMPEEDDRELVGEWEAALAQLIAEAA
jgi:hypothetical protein